MSKLALYFGVLRFGVRGHILRARDGRNTLHPQRRYPGFPWDIGELDGGLLRRARVPNVPDGRLWWTCVGELRKSAWHAFCWWDGSGSSVARGNSGFYVGGFAREDRDAALAFAYRTWPEIVERQLFDLVPSARQAARAAMVSTP